MELREAQKRWLDQVRSISGVTLTEIARRANMNPSSLTQFYNKEHRAGTLETLSLRRISDAMGVPVSSDALGEAGPLNSGFREIEAEPYQIDLRSPVSAAVDAMIDDRDHVHPWTLRSNALDMAGYRPGDILIVDLNGKPSAGDIVYSNLFTGVHGNYLKGSIVAAGLDPDALPESDPSKMNFGSSSSKAWRDIWGAGQGVGAVKQVLPAKDVVARLTREYQAARERLKLS